MTDKVMNANNVYTSVSPYLRKLKRQVAIKNVKVIWSQSIKPPLLANRKIASHYHKAAANHFIYNFLRCISIFS